MSDADDFRSLIDRARGGDQAALADLVRRYEPEVRLVARLRLGSALRPHLDSIDLVQSVHHSLMVGLRANRFEIATPRDLVALALTIVRRKAARARQKLKRQQRLSGEGDGLARTLLDLASPDEDPARAAEYRDTVKLGLSADVLRVKLSRLRARLRSQGVLAEEP